MPTPLAIEHPDERPVWLDRWPSEAETRAMFPEGIRRLAYRFLGAERRKQVQWSDERLVVNIGNQQATWRLRPDGWQRSCTCGYINDRCPHAYIAACLLNEVVRHEGWTPSHPASPRTATASSMPISHHAAERPDVSTKPPPPNTSRTRTEPTPDTPSSRSQLEAEADFHHEPGRVTLRFYRQQNNQRHLLRLQTLTNLAERAAAGSTPTDWSTDDASFLRWLAPQLRRRSDVRANLQVMKLERDQFDSWLQRWESTPGRFIERASQEHIGAGGTQPAHLVFELTPEADWIRIAAVLVLPSGRRRPFHDVFRQLGAGGEDSIISGEILKFTTPVSADLLSRVFSRKDPKLRREHICEHLPALLENRLDIVEGSCVRRRAITDRRVCLQALPDGADIILRATIGDLPIPADGAISGRLYAEDEHFVIELLESAGITTVRQLWRDVGANPVGTGSARVQGQPQRVAALREAWRHLPRQIETRVDPRLALVLQHHPKLQLGITLHDQRNFVDLGVHWECEGVHVTDGTIREALRFGQSVIRTRDGQWLALDLDRARELGQQLDQQGLGSAGPQRLFRGDARERLEQLSSSDGMPAVLPSCRQLAERLRREVDPEPLPLPEHLVPILRPYQRLGFDFLADRTLHGVGAILADDMGLGKTLQVLALMESWVQRRRQEKGTFQALVVCPASVVGVWLDQAARFSPVLRCRAIAGPSESRMEALCGNDWDVAVTNYTLLRLDAETYRELAFDLVVLDEAQNIKNPEALVTRAAKALVTDRTLALTGTPLENRLLDLWSIMDFLNPGFFGTADGFAARVQADSGKQDLSRQLGPVMLRRTKEAVAPELPPRTEEIIHVDMTPEQRAVYDRELVRARELVQSRGPIELLAALTRLRQICCDAALLHPTLTDASSAKLTTLTDMLRELADEGHSALVFSQFTTMLERIRVALEKAGLQTLTLTGKTPTAQRTERVREFNEADKPVIFLLSLRAAGTGLTLTRADYVFIFDPWWNPAVERQAIDRTHRIGQEKPVFAYRLVANDSVEEKVLRLQQEKATLFAEVMGEAETRDVAERLTAEDLRLLLA